MKTIERVSAPIYSYKHNYVRSAVECEDKLLYIESRFRLTYRWSAGMPAWLVCMSAHNAELDMQLPRLNCDSSTSYRWDYYVCADLLAE